MGLFDRQVNSVYQVCTYFLLGCSLGSIAISTCVKEIPRTKDVQRGFVPPSKIERISAEEDLDKSGKPETTMRIDGKDYFLKYDSNNIPTLVPYKVETNVIESQTGERR